ncbi:hypothetical protein KQI88_10295 [Alkaliphilus sp. MSJ-5]|uniref:Uncharacterized protein n=1 Tax=Alkaliphilus flagellatus TaxID=2841507 RepID=A0ABS6G2U6_9FIRM|nr:hypothetical protein [Alkaliphilus flagellatus]MBU5676808.1 hypothetical protein [Alkaliphilus flagellatus]
MNIERFFNFNNKEEKEIDTPVFKIKDNILTFENNLIQISNISQVSIYPAAKRPVPTYIPIIILIGLIFISFGSNNMKFIGFLFSGIGIYLGYKVYERNANRGDILRIQLNSGFNFSIICKDKDFLYNIIDVLKDCFNNNKSIATIDFQNSVVTIGEQNKVIIDKNSSEEIIA